jgi:hypothetical protein
VVLAAVLVAACWHVAARETSGKGGLVAAGASGVGTTLAVGDVQTFGYMLVRPETATDVITIRSVRPTTSGPLEYLGSVIAGTGREFAGLTTVDQPFPPTDPRLGPLQDSEGAVLVADEQAIVRGWEILVGYRVTGPGTGRQTSLVVEYDTGGRGRTVTLPTEVLVCVGRPGDACIDPEE